MVKRTEEALLDPYTLARDVLKFYESPPVGPLDDQEILRSLHDVATMRPSPVEATIDLSFIDEL